MTEKKDNLESFARRIETRIKAGIKGTDSMERLICRLLTGKDQKTAAQIAMKWVEWMFGKPKERIEMDVDVHLFDRIEAARKRADK